MEALGSRAVFAGTAIMFLPATTRGFRRNQDLRRGRLVKVLYGEASILFSGRIE